ncbi:MAG: divalent-cation tolerance protein CutA [Thermoplasmata archaeon]|nr:MAG: divalent-cation tolerance protein CutA [Thermoplasmata archaeon]
MSFYMVYVTCKDDQEAKNVANHLLEKRLIACANMFPVKSLYRWKGNIESDDEIAVLMKTEDIHKDSIIEEIKALHSYEVPCIEFILITDGNPEYLQWIGDETSVH